jgi:hypothetical protein
MRGLGELRRDQGRYDEAEKLLHEAMVHWREVWGEEHPDTLYTMAALGLVYHSQGRYEEAEWLSLLLFGQIVKKVLEMRKNRPETHFYCGLTC